MIKKYELHLDALIVLALVFAAAIGFIAFQWHESSKLAQARVDLQLKVAILQLQNARLEALAKNCPAAQPPKSQ